MAKTDSDRLGHNLTKEQMLSIQDKVFGQKANAPMSMPLSARAFRALREGKSVKVQELPQRENQRPETS